MKTLTSLLVVPNGFDLVQHCDLVVSLVLILQINEKKSYVLNLKRESLKMFVLLSSSSIIKVMLTNMHN